MTEKHDLPHNRAVSRHDLCFCLRRSGWLFPVGAAVFLLLIPFSTAGLPGDSIFNLDVTHDQMMFRLLHEGAVWPAVAAALGLGLAAGLSLFRFVRDKKETTIFFTLGISRTRLFANRVIAGAVILTGSIALPMALSVGLNLRALGPWEDLVRNAVYLAAGLILTALFSFFLTAAVSFVSGTPAETVIGWATLCSAPTILCYGADLLIRRLFWGNPWGAIPYSGSEEIAPTLLERFSFLNPVLFFRSDLVTYGRYRRTPTANGSDPVSLSPALLIGWGCVCAIVTLAAWRLLLRRQAETAGSAGRSRVLSELIIALTGFLAFSAVFSFLWPFSLGPAVLLGAAAFLAVHLFWRRTLFVRRLRWGGSAVSVAVQGVGILAVCLIFSGGFFGGAARFLENADLSEASVTYVGAPALLWGEASGSSTGTGYYLDGRITVREEETLDAVRELQQLFLDSGRQPTGYSAEAGETVVPYDICFSYTDAQGRQRTWYYDRASCAQLEAMMLLEGCDEVRQSQADLVSGAGASEDAVWTAQAYAQGDVFLTDAYFSQTYRLSMSDEDRQSLLDAVAADVAALSPEARYFPDGTARAVLMFSQNGAADCDYFAYHLDNAFLYLTPAWENTLGWLEERDLLELTAETPEVEYIYLQRFNPYVGINDMTYPMGMYFMAYLADTPDEFLIQKDFGNKYTITDEEQIAALTAVLEDGCSMTRGGWLAAVKLAGQDRYRYLFLPAESAPDFVRG